MTADLVALIEYPEGGQHWSTTQFGPTFRRLLETYGARIESVAVAKLEQVEGVALDESTAVFEFPNAEAARTFWNDPEYRAVVPIRQVLGTWSAFWGSMARGSRASPWPSQRRAGTSSPMACVSSISCQSGWLTAW